MDAAPMDKFFQASGEKLCLKKLYLKFGILDLNNKYIIYKIWRYIWEKNIRLV